MLPSTYPAAISRTSFIGDRSPADSTKSLRSHALRAADQTLRDPPVDRPSERLLDRCVAQGQRLRGFGAVVGVTVDERPHQLAADTRRIPVNPCERLGCRRRCQRDPGRYGTHRPLDPGEPRDQRDTVTNGQRRAAEDVPLPWYALRRRQ